MSFFRRLAHFLSPHKPIGGNIPAERPHRADIVFMDNTPFIRRIEKRNGREDFPKTHRHYILYTPEEHEEYFFPAAVEVAQKVCESRAVLRSFTCFSDKEAELSLFRKRYRMFLQHAYPAWAVFEKDAQTFVVLSDGFPSFPFRYAPQTEKDRFEVSDAFFVFPKGTSVSSAQQAASAIDEKQHTLSLSFHECPDELYFMFDPKDENIDTILAAVKLVSDKHGLTLACPPNEECP